jgi:type IV pilus assembly protein PilC
MNDMPTPEFDSSQRFHYDAQTPDGHALSGTLTAADADDARATLDQIGVRLIALQHDTEPVKPKAIRGSEFLAFNQQLAQLTKAGLPVAGGLRLIAEDMRSGRLAESIRNIAGQLEAGKSLPEAFAEHRNQFPVLYGQLIDAGIRTNRLPGVLFNLGRHLEMVFRLRAMLWRTAAYPLVILCSIMAIAALLAIYVIPQFREIFADFNIELPMLTELVLGGAAWTAPVVIILAGVLALCVIIWIILKLSGVMQTVIDVLILPLPLIGPVIKQNMIARWCDALRLGVEAGMDLPATFDMAGCVVGSPLLQRDGAQLVTTLEAGKDINQHARLAIAPAMVPAAIHLASHQHDLAVLLTDLSAMYEQQAELRLAGLQAVLPPILLVILAVIIGFIVMALFLPLVNMMQSVM